MKSFKQFDEAYTDRFAHTSAEDDNKHLVNIHDDKVVQRLNGYVGRSMIESIYNQRLLSNNLTTN